MDFNRLREEGAREAIAKCKSPPFNYITGNEYMKDVHVLKSPSNKKVVKFRRNTYLHKTYIPALPIPLSHALGYLHVISEMQCYIMSMNFLRKREICHETLLLTRPKLFQKREKKLRDYEVVASSI